MIFFILKYFPPRQEWMINRRHQRPETSPGILRPLARHTIERCKTSSTNGRLDRDNRQVIRPHTTDFNEQTCLDLNHDGYKTKRKRKRRKTRKTKKTEKNKKSDSKVEDNKYGTREAHTPPDIKTSEPDSDDIESDCNTKTKRTKKTIVKGHKHTTRKRKTKDKTQDKLPKLKIKSNSFISNEITSNVVEWNKLPSLPIPSNWKWNSNSKQSDTVIPKLNTKSWWHKGRTKYTKIVSPSTWKLYENPNQFRKRPPTSVTGSSINSFKSLRFHSIKSRTIL